MISRFLTSGFQLVFGHSPSLCPRHGAVDGPAWAQLQRWIQRIRRKLSLIRLETATALTSFGLFISPPPDCLTQLLIRIPVEVIIHTILCIRQVYPPTTFTRRRAHGVPVYQSRHPQVREYVAEVTSLIGKEMDKGNARRVTLVIKTVDTGLPLERFIIDLGYLAMDKVVEAHQRETPWVVFPIVHSWDANRSYGMRIKEDISDGIGDSLIGAPGADELSLMLRGFLIRLTALDGQLEDNRGLFLDI